MYQLQSPVDTEKRYLGFSGENEPKESCPLVLIHVNNEFWLILVYQAMLDMYLILFLIISIDT